jgi:hypothetical protein
MSVALGQRGEAPLAGGVRPSVQATRLMSSTFHPDSPCPYELAVSRVSSQSGIPVSIR